MFWNPYLLIAFIGGGALYYYGQRLAGSSTCRRSRWRRGVWCAMLCLPGLSFNLYYAHLLPEPWWYINIRSLPGIEVLSAGWGLAIGYWCTSLVGRQASLLRVAAHTLAGVFAALCIAVPFIKPILVPVESTQRLQNRWDGPVCQQTSESTCGPAALASIFGYFGLRHTEREIARGSYAGGSGTELWYLIRYARQHGLHASGMRPRRLSEVPIPAILGTTTSPGPGPGPASSGHFIVLLGKTGDAFHIGDPQGGMRMITDTKFADTYGRLCDAVYFWRHGGGEGVPGRLAELAVLSDR